MLLLTSLFISDLDGTLLNDKQVISEESIVILNKLISQGLQFTIATARSYNRQPSCLRRLILSFRLYS